MKIGIICPSEIAIRRFLPALQKTDKIEYVGVAYASFQEWFNGTQECEKKISVRTSIQQEAIKAEKIQQAFGGKVFCGYRNMIESDEVDAVYIPLPPALHFIWAKAALENHLHVFVEKPSTVSLKDTAELVRIAEKNSLALYENYMFVLHSQLQEVADAVKNGEIGSVRLYRIDFGFPYRGADDFRYKKELGGGALLDCGGYALKYANILLGGKAKVVQADVSYENEQNVEIFGSGVLKNREGVNVQIAFGMDNEYRCNIDIWGSRGTLFSSRILTAPDGFVPSYTITKDGKTKVKQMYSDDAFQKSIQKFMDCIEYEEERKNSYREMLRQQFLVEEFARLADMKN